MDGKLQILLMEYELVVGSINNYIDSQFKVLNAGILIISGSLTLAYQYNVESIYPIIPLAMLVLLTYFLYRLERNSLLQEYRIYLESEINKKHHTQGNRIIFYGRIAETFLRNRNPLTLIQIGYYIIVYLASGYRGRSAIKYLEQVGTSCHSTSLADSYFIFIIVMMILLLYFLWKISFKAKSRFKRVKEEKFIEFIATDSKDL